MPKALIASRSLPEEFRSFFLTTRRNEVLHLFVTLVQYPAYIICCSFIIEYLTQLLNAFVVPLFLGIVLWTVALLPILATFATHTYWHMGFRSRERAFVVSLIILFGLLKHDPLRVLSIFWFAFFFLLSLFLVRLLGTRTRRLLDRTAWILLLLLLGTMSVPLVILWGIGENQGLPPLQIPYVEVLSPLIQFHLLRIIVFLLIVCPMMIGVWQMLVLWHDKYAQQFHSLAEAAVRTFWWSIGLSLFTAAIFWGENLVLISVLGLLVLLWVSNLSLYISRQQAHWRNIFKSVRHDHIHDLISPILTPVSWFRRLLYPVQVYVRDYGQWIWITLLILFGGLGAPRLAMDYFAEKDVLRLMTIGIVTSMFLIIVYLVVWFIRHRPKHIVMPFEVNDNEDIELKVLANLVTQSFVERLRHIMLLLSMRQVESVSLRSDNGLSIFVTSGQEQEWVEQIRSLGNIEATHITLPLGNLLAYLLTSLAHTRVHGIVQRQKDNNVAIWLEYTQRDGRKVAVDFALLPENTVKDIDETLLNQIAYTLAIKLLVKLGHHAHLASSWESLQHFLDGLDAGYRRNWRHAIACYRESIHIEETVRGSFGIGYYHLGASLVFQGEVREGLKYLQTAEINGPPLAETQYMIALAELYLNRDRLHIDRNVFEDIKWRCRQAMQLRPIFPEAHHLLGTAFYQRGKLRERLFSRRPKVTEEDEKLAEPAPKYYLEDYYAARRYLQKAMSHYDAALNALPNDIISQTTIWDEQARLIRDRMAVTHRLGDAERCLEHYSLADSYYEDTLAAFPGNLRTMVDQAKTYCLSGNWQRADEFLRYNVFSFEGAKWNKSVNFYMGWAQVGGLADDLSPQHWIANWLVVAYELIGTVRIRPLLAEGWKYIRDYFRDDTRKIKSKLRLGKAIAYLDYALYQYPRYILRWRQTNWLIDFRVAANALDSQRNRDRRDPDYCRRLYNTVIDPTNDVYVEHLRYWLAWRIHSYLFHGEESADNFARKLLDYGENVEKFREVPYPPFEAVYRSLHQFHARLCAMLQEDDQADRFYDLQRIRDRLKFADEIYRLWIESSKEIEALTSRSNTERVTFAERWAVDVYNELSLLLTRALMEGGAFEYVYEVAKRASDLLWKWTGRWDRVMFDATPFHLTFSPRVASYQLSTLFAWQAYALIQIKVDFATRARQHLRGRDIFTEGYEEEIRSAIEHAFQFVPHHPLAMFTQSLVSREQNLPRQSIDELNRVLTSIAPFDPHKYVLRDDVDEIGQLPHRVEPEVLRDEQPYPPQPPLLALDKAQIQFHYKEHISGRLQFDSVVNKAFIHLALAESFVKLGELTNAADQLLLALAASPYYDLNAELFLELALILDKQGRWLEAITAVQEATRRRLGLSKSNQPTSASNYPQIFSSIIYTNAGHYHIALQQARLASRQISLSDFLTNHRESFELLKKTFDSYPIASVLLEYEKTYLAEHSAPINEGLLLLTMLEVARTNLDPGDLAEKLLNLGGKVIKEFDADQILLSQIVLTITCDHLDGLIQQCDLSNNSAFNQAELGLDLNLADSQAQNAVKIMEKLLEGILPRHSLKYQERLAEYYDTLAWVNYRQGNLKGLKKARELLHDKALARNPSSALIYYHLSRVCLTQLEGFWQGLSASSRAKGDLESNKAKEISQYLRDAFFYWRRAQRLDTHKNLTSRLRLVRQRIDTYREKWNKLQ